MANSNIDFLRFSAYSMKELITRKLSEDSRFTDQVYEGSNLAILIDIVSYMYQCLAYQLNSAAAESMFADTQLYDNMIRLVQFIGYNPRGCVPAQFTGRIQTTSDVNREEFARKLRVPMFAYFDTQKVGSSGKTICFSVDGEAKAFESDTVNLGIDVPFYNGRWRVYPTVFTASGLENEMFVLDGLRSDSDGGKYVSGEFVRAVVETQSAAGSEYELDWHNDSNGIFTMSNREYYDIESEDNISTNLYDPRSKVYTVCLNENKAYELKFGDGITGRRLKLGDRVYVFYLESDGKDGEMDLAEIDFSQVKLRHDRDQMEAVIPAALSEKMFGPKGDDSGSDKFVELAGEGKIRVSTTQNVTTSFKREEDVGDIRNNAPGWFKTGNRLITARDTEYYVKAYGDTLGLAGVVDVKCMNNMQYVATLYKWLYENGIKSKDHPDRKAEAALGVDPGKYYLDNVTFNRANFKYVDPADANNTYLWIKTQSAMQDAQVASEQSQQFINNKLYHLKTITTEYQIVKPVLVKFAVCANPDVEDIKARYFNETDTDFDQKCESRIEVTLDDNIIYVSSNIQKLVYDEIVRAFDVNAQRLGGIVKFQEITDRIYAINGVQRVRTVYINGDHYRAYDGVSFASWSDESVLHFHEDLQVGNVMRHVEEFQFPVLEGEGLLMQRIKVITKAMQRVHAIKF